MVTQYTDYTNNVLLNMRHQLLRVRNIPLRGSMRLSRMLEKIVATPKPDGLCRVKTLHGYTLLVDPIVGKGLELAVFSRGTYEEGTLRLITRLLGHGGIFIDVGANIGLMTLHAASILQRSGRVVAFEPVPNVYQLLQQNVDINNFSNVKAENSAVGATNGTMDIYQNLDVNRGSATLSRSNDAVPPITVPVVALDDYVRRNTIRDIACMKIDVEGWELEVLRGAHDTLSGTTAPACIIECSTQRHSDGGTVNDIYTFITTTNEYRVFRPCRSKELPSRLRRIGLAELPAHDNIVCLLPAHIEKLPANMFVS
jgi:FkbM family methyltransferase